MKITPIQFQVNDSDAARLEKLKRLAAQVAAGSNTPEVTTTASDGSQWFTGHGAPAASLGSSGDLYLDLDTGDIYELVS